MHFLSRMEVQDFEIATAPEHLDKVVEMVYNHKSMPRLFGHPLMQKEQTETMQHPDLATAKQKMFEALERFEAFFKANLDLDMNTSLLAAYSKKLPIQYKTSLTVPLRSI